MVDVSTIYLVEGGTDNAIEAELRDAIEQAQLADWKLLWQPALIDVLKQRYQASGFKDFPENWHWDWQAKMASVTGLLAYRGFSVVAGGETQGLSRIDLTGHGREPSQRGKPIIYLDYLEVAPWNRRDLGFDPPRFGGVGSALLTAAVALSEEEGFHGRVGLHSLPRADDFYRKCGFTDLGQDPAVQNLRYFEITAEQAGAFLEKE
jgi:GNAT superfamily N-acetyltransferase